MGGKATRRHRRHRVVDRIEAVHARQEIADRAEKRDDDIDREESAAEAREPGKWFVTGVGGFHLEERHAADPEIGDDEQAEHDDADAAEPAQK